MRRPIAASALFIALACGACLSSQEGALQGQKGPETGPAIAPSNIDLAKPLKASEKPEDIAASKKISGLISDSEFANARWGIVAISLKDGRIVVAKDAEKLFAPASVLKLITAAAALDKLGADFRWQTRVLAEREISPDGVLSGDLILYGEGAPDFNAEGLKKLADALQAKGLKRVSGNIIGDESYFKGDSLGDGWTWNEAQWYYGAEASALTFSENQTKITLDGGKPDSPTKFVETSGSVGPIEDIEAIGLKKELGENKVYVWGNGRNLEARIAVSHPALWAAQALKETLESRGVAIEGKAEKLDWKSGLERKGSLELAKVESQSLAEIIRKMNKDSVNLYAELILRTLGKKFGSEAPDENPKMQKLRGDDSAGAAYIEKWLADNKLSNGDAAIHDGSGLSRLGLISPETLARVLVFANQAKFAGIFKDSLPVAGTDGTLRGRLKGKKIIAKTGSVTYVNSLAGYADSSGESLAFVVVCNNETRKNEPAALIDEIASTFLK